MTEKSQFASDIWVRESVKELRAEAMIRTKLSGMAKWHVIVGGEVNGQSEIVAF